MILPGYCNDIPLSSFYYTHRLSIVITKLSFVGDRDGSASATLRTFVATESVRVQYFPMTQVRKEANKVFFRRIHFHFAPLRLKVCSCQEDAVPLPENVVMVRREMTKRKKNRLVATTAS